MPSFDKTVKVPISHVTYTVGPCWPGGSKTTVVNSTYSNSDTGSGTSSPKDASGWRPPTAYTRIKYRNYRLVNFYLSLVKKNYEPSSDMFYQQIGAVILNEGTWPTPPAVPSDIVTEATNKVVSKLKNRAGANVAQAFAERRQTADLVTSSCGSIYQSIKKLKRGDFKGAARALGLTGKILHKEPTGALANKWLSLQYGWMPLYSDIYDASSMLVQNDLSRPKRYCVGYKADSLETRQYSTTANLNLASLFLRGCSSGTVVPGSLLIRDNRTSKCRVRADWYLTNPRLVTMAQLGLLNPAALAWELVPFSFVADWFLPIGNYLSCLDATIGWSFRGGSVSSVSEINREYVPVVIPSSRYHISWEIDAHSAGSPRAVVFKRTVLTTSPSAKPPRFNLDGLTHGSRALNAIALLRGFIKSI